MTEHEWMIEDLADGRVLELKDTRGSWHMVAHLHHDGTVRLYGQPERYRMTDLASGLTALMGAR